MGLSSLELLSAAYMKYFQSMRVIECIIPAADYHERKAHDIRVRYYATHRRAARSLRHKYHYQKCHTIAVFSLEQAIFRPLTILTMIRAAAYYRTVSQAYFASSLAFDDAASTGPSRPAVRLGFLAHAPKISRSRYWPHRHSRWYDMMPRADCTSAAPSITYFRAVHRLCHHWIIARHHISRRQTFPRFRHSYTLNFSASISEASVGKYSFHLSPLPFDKYIYYSKIPILPQLPPPQTLKIIVTCR